jgi:small subunit ribosomal protein S17e
MGRIKGALIKRTARALNKEEGNVFSEDFNNNKNILGGSMPSKKLRNGIAGYITRMRRNLSKKNRETAHIKEE